MKGDSIAESGWLALPDDAHAQLDGALFQYQGDRTKRRMNVAHGIDGEATGVDMELLTAKKSPPGRSYVLPVRRMFSGQVSHPPPGTRHPWYDKKVALRDTASTGDWLTNDFFFRAFSLACPDIVGACTGFSPSTLPPLGPPSTRGGPAPGSGGRAAQVFKLANDHGTYI